VEKIRFDFAYIVTHLEETDGDEVMARFDTSEEVKKYLRSIGMDQEQAQYREFGVIYGVDVASTFWDHSLDDSVPITDWY